MYPQVRIIRAALVALLCVNLVGGWTRCAAAQIAEKPAKARKGVGRRPGDAHPSLSSPTTFSNPAPITIHDADASNPAAATPYPSNITVAGMGSRNHIRVRLNGLSHANPSDIDILLVGPGGQRFMLMSDVGGAGSITNLTVTFDDAAAATPQSTLATGTFRPSDVEPAGDEDTAFPGAAPAAPYAEPAPAGSATLDGIFGTTSPNGVWSLYVVDDSGGNEGSISGGWDLTLTPAEVPVFGELVISELRFEAVGLSPGGESGDDFVEVQNVSVQTLDLSGLKLRLDIDGTQLFDVIIPDGTFLLPGQHFLAANASNYSLGAIAAPDLTYQADLFGGVQLTFPDNRVLDEAGRGMLGENDRLIRASGIFRQNSHVRRQESGRPRDTFNNAIDFAFVSTTGMLNDGTLTVLGAPGPQNRQSPITRNFSFKAVSIDPAQPPSASPNSVRKFCATPGVEECDANRSQFGTFSIRRRWINNTGHPVSRLRFRIVDFTTLGSPNVCNGCAQADLRAISSSQLTGVMVSGGGTVTVEGTTLDEPTQALGGGLNSALTAGTITPSQPLAAGESINLQFLLGVQQPGFYRFFVNVEALP